MKCFRERALTVSLLALALLTMVSCLARGQEKSVRPGINQPFEHPEVQRFVGVFEGESREIFTKREELVAACKLKPGMVVGDIGAGTGLFTRLFASAVGERGKVYAVDIAREFIDHIDKTCKQKGLKNVAGVVCTQTSTELPAESIDVAFICDTYHHFEFPAKTMRSIHRALRPGGRVILVDFKRIKGVSSDWVMNHVRAGQETFTKEIVSAGFKVVEEAKILKENYCLVFQKVETAQTEDRNKASSSEKTPLDDYLARPDPTYSWKVVNTIPGEGYTTFVVDLKSQSWRSVPEIDRSVWQHWLVIVKPAQVQQETAFLSVGGGKNGDRPPTGPSAQTVRYAKMTNSVAAELRMIPNQPLVFNGDGKPRVEDDLIAYCWIKYMETGDATWLPRLPMVKSVVRAMDTVTALLASPEGGKTPINKFVVAGGSKRGWTTWLTGAADRRVAAIVPVVIDVVNVRACSINHFCSYGFWAPALGDYNRHKIHEQMDTPEYARLLKIVDPYFYRDRLRLPKFIVNAAGDQYFPPDSSKFYFDDLQGIKYLRYVPNADHSLRGSDAQESILAFYQAILKQAPLPKFTWQIDAGGSIRVQTEDQPREVNLWQATNPKARDFRLVTLGPAYKKSPLESKGNGLYVAQVPKPQTGWTALFVELVFDSGEKIPFKFTTQVSIVPDRLPHTMQEFHSGRE
jgi:PhoPQ-activated pathogenicity-related protein/ubiquinone/menaquinone biosynthesis C-methylase UbiE